MTSRAIREVALVAMVMFALVACGDDGGAGDGGVGPDTGAGLDGGPRPDTGPLPDSGVVMPSPGEYTHRLDESPPGLDLWTAPVAHRIAAGERAPTESASGIAMAAARSEREAAQLIIGPGAGQVTVTVAPFAGLTGARVDVMEATFTSGWAEGLVPRAAADSIALDGARPTVIWFMVTVPADAAPGAHETTVTLGGAGGDAVIPLRLTVFDFDLPREIHFRTQLNINVSSLVADGDVDSAKTMLFEHRFTPKSVTWPSGFNYGITWDSGANPMRCSAFWDEPDEPDQFSIGWLSQRYMLGEGWNGVGFPTAMLFQFVDNGTPRPDTFCGESRGASHLGTAAYDAEWSGYLAGLYAYLAANGMDQRGYYYVQNEPQDAADYTTAAHLCRVARAAAPNLRIAVSEEAKPEIAEHADGACGYDIWIAHLPAYEETYAHERHVMHGEESWFYSLDRDADPYPNPTTMDRQGMHQRILPWMAWSLRIRGWAYYDFGRFFDGARPGVRAEILREGFEDYEYLWLANGSAEASPAETVAVDATARSVAGSLTGWTRDADAFMALRRELGRFIEGSRTTVPALSVATDRPRGDYYVNFQDPGGAPSADPLVVGGNEYIKVGWQPYDDDDGYGWFGENIDNPSIAMTGYDDAGGYDEVQKSYLYDDYGRPGTFEFAIENGTYQVTLGVGRPARGYPGDPHNATVEGMVVVDDEVTTDGAPTIERTVTVDVVDGRLTVEVGGRSRSTGDFAYTFVAYLAIEAI